MTNSAANHVIKLIDSFQDVAGCVTNVTAEATVNGVIYFFGEESPITGFEEFKYFEGVDGKVYVVEYIPEKADNKLSSKFLNIRLNMPVSGKIIDHRYKMRNLFNQLNEEALGSVKTELSLDNGETIKLTTKGYAVVETVGNSIIHKNTIGVYKAIPKV